MDAGRPFNIRLTGPSDIRRIEAGILNCGADMTLENNPYEVGLQWLIDADKPTKYIGAEALQRIKTQGVARSLVGIEIEGDRIGFNTTKWLAVSGGQTIDRVTSAIWSPQLRKNIGYAMVPLTYAALDAIFDVEVPDSGVRRATVVKKPFVDPTKEIPKS